MPLMKKKNCSSGTGKLDLRHIPRPTTDPWHLTQANLFFLLLQGVMLTWEARKWPAESTLPARWQGGCAGNVEAKRCSRNRNQEGTQDVWKAFHLEASHNDGAGREGSGRGRVVPCKCLKSLLQPKPSGCVWRTNRKYLFPPSCVCTPRRYKAWGQRKPRLAPNLWF